MPQNSYNDDDWCYMLKELNTMSRSRKYSYDEIQNKILDFHYVWENQVKIFGEGLKSLHIPQQERLINCYWNFCKLANCIFVGKQYEVFPTNNKTYNKSQLSGISQMSVSPNMELNSALETLINGIENGSLVRVSLLASYLKRARDLVVSMLEIDNKNLVALFSEIAEVPIKLATQYPLYLRKYIHQTKENYTVEEQDEEDDIMNDYNEQKFKPEEDRSECVWRICKGVSNRITRGDLVTDGEFLLGFQILSSDLSIDMKRDLEGWKHLHKYYKLLDYVQKYFRKKIDEAYLEKLEKEQDEE